MRTVYLLVTASNNRRHAARHRVLLLRVLRAFTIKIRIKSPRSRVLPGSIRKRLGTDRICVTRWRPEHSSPRLVSWAKVRMLFLPSLINPVLVILHTYTAGVRHVPKMKTIRNDAARMLFSANARTLDRQRSISRLKHHSAHRNKT